MRKRKVLAMLVACSMLVTAFQTASYAEDEAYFDFDDQDYQEYQDSQIGLDNGVFVVDDFDDIVGDGFDDFDDIPVTDEGMDDGMLTDGAEEGNGEELIISAGETETGEMPIETPTPLPTPTPVEVGEVTPTPDLSAQTPTPVLTPTKAPVDLSKAVYLLNVDEDGLEEVVATYDSIQEMIAYAVSQKMEDIDIRLMKDLVLNTSVTVPGDMVVTIDTGSDVTVSRDSSFTGSMFQVAEGGDLTLMGGYSEEDEQFTLTVDCMNIPNEGTIIFVANKANLSLLANVVLERNATTAAGSAIYICSEAESVTLQSTEISGNTVTSGKGGAIYTQKDCTAELNIGGDGGTVVIDDNQVYTEDGNVPGNIFLENAGEKATKITLQGDLAEGSKIGITVGNPAKALHIVEEGEDADFEDKAAAYGAFTYDGDGYSFSTQEGQEGYLTDGTEIVTPTPTPEVEETVTPTPIDQTITPTPGDLTPTPADLTPTVTVTTTPVLTVTTTPIYVTATLTPTPVVTLTNTPVPPRSYYIPPVNSAADGFKVTGLEYPLEFPAYSNNTFSVTGASAETRYGSSLVVGDGKWSPYYWMMVGGQDKQNLAENENSVYTTRTYNIMHKNGIYNENKTYSIRLYFKLFTWGGSGWVTTTTVQYADASFTAAYITPTGSAIATATPTRAIYYTATPTTAGGNSGGTVNTNTTDYLALTRAAQTPAAQGATVAAGSVSTGDASHVGAYTMMALLSLLAAAFAFVRRRKA